MGAVVITYNLRGIASGLKLSPEVIAGIFTGEIAQWNDPQLVKLNPRVRFPANAITVVHRSDNSGTTAVFTDYLSKVSQSWKATVGSGTSVKWPVGSEAKGNEGVSQMVTSTSGAIGYVELSYAVQAMLPLAILRNQSGKFIWAQIESVTAAAAGATVTMPADLRVSLTDAPGEESYPISSFTYLLVYEDNPDKAKGEALAKFLKWTEHQGQTFCAPLWYAPLPPEVVAKVDAKLKSLTAKGQKLLNN